MYLDNFNHDIRGSFLKGRIVFLHGLMGAWVNWRKIISAFEAEYQILSYDQRGHGKSFQPETGYEPEDYANDLYQIVNELGWERFHLVGHSMGGRNAFMFAHKYPERLESVVVEDITPSGSLENINKIENILNKVPTPFDDKRVAKETILASYEDQVLANYLYSNIAETKPGVFDWRFSKNAIIESVRGGRSRSRWNEWSEVGVKGLLIRGEKSDELSHEDFVKMLDLNKSFLGVEIKDAAHWVHFDKPAEFIIELRQFWNSVENKK